MLLLACSFVPGDQSHHCVLEASMDSRGSKEETLMAFVIPNRCTGHSIYMYSQVRELLKIGFSHDIAYTCMSLCCLGDTSLS